MVGGDSDPPGYLPTAEIIDLNSDNIECPHFLPDLPESQYLHEMVTYQRQPVSCGGIGYR